MLREFGIADRICKEFEVTIEELHYLAMIEDECQKMANTGKENHVDN